MELKRDIPFRLLNVEEIVDSRGEDDVQEILHCPRCSQEFCADEFTGRTDEGYVCVHCGYEYKGAEIEEEDDGSPEDPEPPPF